MLLEDFVDEMNEMSEGLDYFAREASTIEDCPYLQAAGKAFEQAEKNLRKALSKAGVEVG